MKDRINHFFKLADGGFRRGNLTEARVAISVLLGMLASKNDKGMNFAAKAVLDVPNASKETLNSILKSTMTALHS